MDKKKQLMGELLDRYERSRLFREGSSAQRILIDASKCGWIRRCMEDADEKREFLDVLRELADDGLAGFSWVKYETGNLVDRIWLCTEEDALAESYRLAGRVPKAGAIEVLLCQVEEARDHCLEQKESCMDQEKSAAQADILRNQGEHGAYASQYGICDFLEESADDIRNKKKIPRFFFPAGESAAEQKKAEEKNGRLLLFLEKMFSPEDEQMERVISSRLFGDSKYFEHELKSKVLSVLRYIEKKNDREPEEDEHLLAGYGIVKWPEILEFCGDVRAFLDDGSRIDFGNLRYGAYINSETVKHISRVEPGPSYLSGNVRILTIENKANYTWYLNEKKENELVLYHGGFLSPVRRRWFRMIYEGIRAENPEARFLHWSDIDAGGFRMFQMLRSFVFPEAEPYRMDRKTLEQYEDRCMPIETEAYQRLLVRLKEDENYRVFRDVIEYMLEKNIRLEQETLIW